MLDPWIIEQIRSREEQQRRREEENRGRIEIQIEMPEDPDRQPGRSRDEPSYIPPPPSERGVAIIHFGS